MNSQNETTERRILIVDDDRDFLESLIEFLEPHGYESVAAYSAGSAREAMKDFCPQAALIDLKLPDGSGTALLSEIRQYNPDCACIMITGHADVDSAVYALKKGAFHYLRKPLNPEELLNLLGLVFETISLREEKRRAAEAIRKRERQLTASQRVARLGSWEWDVINNKITWTDELYRLFGVTPGEFEATYEAFLSMVHPDDRQALDNAVKESLLENKPYHYNARIIRRDGSEWIMEARGEVQYDESGNPVIMSGTAQDITELKKAEEHVRKSLKEKEALLQEIHHRVKNNMTVISSMLSLQAEQIKDEQYRGMFNDSMSRIKSMALIHEKLYISKDLSEVDFSDYIGELTGNMLSSYYVHKDKIALKADAEGIHIDMDRAIPCGLIINELVSNALKYAFPGDREGEIKVTLREISDSKTKDSASQSAIRDSQSTIELIVCDNGVGMPEGLDFRNTGTLGLRMVNTLARQLNGEIEMDCTEGTELRIRFRNKKNRD